MTDDLLRQDGNSSNVPGLEEARTITWIDMLHRQYFDEFTNAGGNYPEYMRKHYGDTMVANTSVAADFAAGASTFTIDSSDALSTSGAGVIYKNYQYDIFTHTGNASGTVSGVSGIDFAHDDGEIVSKLYALPSDFGRMRTEANETRYEGVRVNGLGNSKVSDMPSYRQYALWDNGGQWYLWLPYVTTGEILTIYDKKPTSLTVVGSTIDIPEQYADHMYIVWGLVALFKQTLDDDYVGTKERMEQLKYVQTAIKRGNTGRPVSASNAYFKRYGI